MAVTEPTDEPANEGMPEALEAPDLSLVPERPTVQIPVDVLQWTRNVLAQQQVPAGSPNFMQWAMTIGAAIAEIDAALATTS